MSAAKQYPAVEGLFTWPSESPRLIGGRCEACESYFFPKHAEFHKPGCSGGPVKQVLLSGKGTLVSHTIVRYPPPPPFEATQPFLPLAVGTAALPEGIQIPGMITGCALEEVRVGLEVDIVLGTLSVDNEGNEALTWKFQPVQHRQGRD